MIDDLLEILLEFGFKKGSEFIKNKDFKEDDMFDYVIKCPKCSYKQNVTKENIVSICKECSEYIFVNKDKNISFCNECGKVFDRYTMSCDECKCKTNIYENENLRYCEKCKNVFVSRAWIKTRVCPYCSNKGSKKANVE